MHQVQTDHQIVPFGPDLMKLFGQDGTVIATAQRDNEAWSIHADGYDTTTAPNRPDAITGMIEHAYKHLRGGEGQGFSTLVPHGLPELP